jgi:pimeloyl-ACP methyl ester carboxylesterase
VEWSALRWSPTFYGLAVPRGRGEAVVVIPGFLGSDPYLADLRGWLRRIGYRPYPSGVGRNADCLDRLADRLDATIDEALEYTGKKVHLVGHSLGGVLARGVAARRPAPIASVTTLGSPLRGLRSHPSALRAGERVRQQIQAQGSAAEPADPDCYTGYCSCSFVRGLTQGKLSEEIAQMAIYTRTDGVVDWRYCRLPDSKNNLEVIGTHCGLAFNAQVYRRLAHFLAGLPASQIQVAEQDPSEQAA